MIEIVPNWHPIWVHFAVALLTTATGLALASHWRSRSWSDGALVAARWTLGLGVCFAAAALLTGYWASNSVVHDDPGHANMLVHRNWALAAGGIFLLAAIIELRRNRRQAASPIGTVLMIAGALALGKAAYEGGQNVYEHGLGVQRLPQPSEHDHGGDSGHGHGQPAQETQSTHESGSDEHGHDSDRATGTPEIRQKDTDGQEEVHDHDDHDHG